MPKYQYFYSRWHDEGTGPYPEAKPGKQDLIVRHWRQAAEDLILLGDITVPSDVITEWHNEAVVNGLTGIKYLEFIVTKAGSYCAELELTACDDYLHEVYDFEKNTLLKKRRPEKAASLVKHKAIELINRIKAEPSSWGAQDLAVLEEALALIPDSTNN